ncbi:MAG: hypothetical protein AAGF19_11300, partial [Pseudomonadota bacterium]
QVGRLTKGASPLTPGIDLLADELLPAADREAALERLRTWFTHYLNTEIKPLMELAQATSGDGPPTDRPEITGLARGLGFRLVEGLGSIDRAAVAGDVKSLDQTARGSLRKYGVRFGEFSIFMPALLKPGPGDLLLLLQAVTEERTRDNAPIRVIQAGLTSAPYDEGFATSLYAARGYRHLGRRVVRIDMLERLAELIRTKRDNKPAQSKRKRGASPAKDTARTGDAAAPRTDAPMPALSLWEQALGASAEPQLPPTEPHAANAETPADAEPEKAALETVDEATSVASATGTSPTEGPASLPPSNDEPAQVEPATDDPGPASPAPVTDALAADAPVANIPAVDAPVTDAPVTEALAANAPVPDAAPAPDLPPGAFQVTPDMMSLVGCGGEDFEDILRSLGFRSHTLEIPAENPASEPSETAVESPETGTAAEPTTLTYWRMAPRGGQRQGQNRRNPRRNRSAPSKQTDGSEAPPAGKHSKARGASDKPGKPASKGRANGSRSHAGKSGGGARPHRTPRAEKQPDPDSPFAVLKALKTGE